MFRHTCTRVEVITGALAPILVYLQSGTSPERLAAISTARGEAWTAYGIEVMTNCPYARRRQLTGGAGALDMLSTYQALLEQLLRESNMPRLELDECSGNWEVCYRRLEDFLWL